MFDSIISALSSALQWLSDTAQQTWDYFKSGWVFVFTTLVAVLAITNRVVDFVWTAVLTLIDAAGYLSVPGGEAATIGGGIANNSLVQMNTFFPVAEGFSLLAALSIIWMAGITYRLVKSWIPTLS